MEREFTISQNRPIILRRGRQPGMLSAFEQAVVDTLDTTRKVTVNILSPASDTNLRARIKHYHPELRVHISNDKLAAQSHVWVSQRPNDLT